jgi:hypothetical protein
MAATNDDVTVLAVGDVSFGRESAEHKYDHVRSILQEGDITFGQLEMTLSNRGEPQLFTGPGWRGGPKPAPIDPVALANILIGDGFDVMSMATNHALDHGENALFDTLDAASETGLRLIGAGRNEAEAREPLIIERDGTKIGFLSWCSVTPRGHEARQNKAGVAPLRARTFYEQVDWQAGTMPKIFTYMLEEDLAAMVADIEKLRPLVDVVVATCHGGIHFEPGTVAMYQHEASHAAVDAGADVVLWSHGAVLKGVEFYKEKPIFYSIGNFALMPKGPYGEFLDEATAYDSQNTAIIKLTVADKAVGRVAMIPCWLDTRLQPETIPPGDARFDRFIEFMEWVNAHNTPPFSTLTDGKRAFPPFEVAFKADGDEVVLTP